MEPEIWTGCYDDGWRDLIVPEAFSHPAKAARGLLVRIFDELFAMGVLARGDVVVDPFAGIGTTGIEAASRGCRFVGCELEPKFVTLAQENFASHAVTWAAMGRPQPAIVQGDSRCLQEHVRQISVQCVLGSPPWLGCGMGISIEGVARHVMTGKWSTHKSDAILDRTNYGDTPGQLAAMKAGDVAAVISSPPYTGITHPTRHGDDYSFKDDESGNASLSVGEYGSAPGQLGAMPTGDVDVVLSSPPYAAIASGAGGLNTQPPKRAGQQGGRSAASASQATDQRYGESDGQLARLSEGVVSAVVSSPPYGEIAQSGGDRGPKEYKTGLTRGEVPRLVYGDTGGQLCQQRGETFWEAARDVVSECYALLKPGGMAVWIVKAFVRKKQLVDFPGDWRRLCEACGFETIREVHAMLVARWEENDLFDGVIKRERRRASFFRRLAEAKGSPKIEWEVVWFMRKPSSADVSNVGND